jgi:hypothetical protein
LFGELENGLVRQPRGRIRLYVQIARHIEAPIVGGKLTPGDRLPFKRDPMQRCSDEAGSRRASSRWRSPTGKG